MNCQEFQKNVDGLARGALLDARVREEASAHEGECGPCAARLADERALTAGLRALAAKMSEAEAPARAEVSLLSAFRSRAASAAQAAETVTRHEPARRSAAVTSSTHAPSNPPGASNVVALSEHAGTRQWSWVRTVAVASMAAAAALALFMLVPPALLPGRTIDSASNNGKAAAPSQASAPGHADSARNETASKNEDDAAPTSQGGVGVQESGLAGDGGPRHQFTPRRAGAPVRASNVKYERGQGVTARGAASETAGAQEVTTDFIPLMQGAAYAPSETTHLVRVELPRSALTSFGIPLDAERTGGRVKADVLLGEDGTARAIRFVR